MGNTGPTIPFLLGAIHDNASAQDMGDLAALLYQFQLLRSHHVRIAPCWELEQPVVSLYGRSETMNSVELVKRPSRPSSLYVSQEYTHKQDIPSVFQSLWGRLSVALTNGQYSFSSHSDSYGSFTKKDRSYIQECKNDGI